MKLHRHIDSVTKYLTPLLPLANCHMVEFITHNHWERLLPTNLRESLNNMDLNDAVDQFWTIATHKNKDTSPLSTWINTARSHCLTINNDYCLSTEQLQQRIKHWGADIRPEIRIKEFMNSKKSYEHLSTQLLAQPVAWRLVVDEVTFLLRYALRIQCQVSLLTAMLQP